MVKYFKSYSVRATPEAVDQAIEKLISKAAWEAEESFSNILEVRVALQALGPAQQTVLCQLLVTLESK